MYIQAKKISLKAKKQVYSGMLGTHSSLFKGQGFDFMELREYQDGDDVKHIDWIVTAKKHKPFVKIFHEQRQLNITLLPLLTGSLHFGTTKVKYELLAQVYAILGFVGLQNADRCQNLFLDKGAKTKKIKTAFELEKDIEYLLGYNYLGSTFELKSLKTLRLSKSLLFVLGDFVGEYDLSYLSQKHEVVAVIIRDRFEQEPSDLGVLDVVDPSVNRSATVSFTQDFAKSYKKAIVENDRKLYAHFRKNQIKFIKIYTDEEPYLKLLQLN